MISKARLLSIQDGRSAERALRSPCAATVRAVAEMADSLRFHEPSKAPGVSAAAVKALARCSAVQGSLKAEVWAIHGSALRGNGLLDQAEMALMTAASLAEDPRTQADVARRLSILRAEQGRAEEARAIIPGYLEWAKVVGERIYGEQLSGASAVLGLLHDYQDARRLAMEALEYLPANGDRFHLSTLFNLGRFSLELASNRAELSEAAALIRRTEELVPGKHIQTKLLWLRALLSLRAGEPAQALDLLEAIRPEIEDTENPLDLAILTVDFAESLLELGDTERAHRVVRECFPLLGQLRERPEAFQALRAIMRIAERNHLSSEALIEARRRLESA